MVTTYQVPLVHLTSTVTREHPKVEPHTVGITTAAASVGPHRALSLQYVSLEGKFIWVIVMLQSQEKCMNAVRIFTWVQCTLWVELYAAAAPPPLHSCHFNIKVHAAYFNFGDNYYHNVCVFVIVISFLNKFHLWPNYSDYLDNDWIGLCWTRAEVILYTFVFLWCMFKTWTVTLFKS